MKECFPSQYDCNREPATGPDPRAARGEGLRSHRAASGTAEDSRTVQRSTVQAVLEGDILFFSLTCTVVPESAITPELMAKMLAAENGISTSDFQLYDAGDGKVGRHPEQFLRNCRRWGRTMRTISSPCVHFLLVDVIDRAATFGRSSEVTERAYGILIGYFRSRGPRGPRPGQCGRGRPRGRHFRDHGQPDRGRHEDRAEQGGAGFGRGA